MVPINRGIKERRLPLLVLSAFRPKGTPRPRGLTWGHVLGPFTPKATGRARVLPTGSLGGTGVLFSTLTSCRTARGKAGKWERDRGVGGT